MQSVAQAKRLWARLARESDGESTCLNLLTLPVALTAPPKPWAKGLYPDLGQELLVITEFSCTLPLSIQVSHDGEGMDQSSMLFILVSEVFCFVMSTLEVSSCR